MKLSTNSISANAVESVTEGGTEWLVADDVTLARPKYLDGGYVPAAAWRESADRWEGVPLPVGHPINENGETVSVHANEAAEEQAEAGVLRNPRFDEEEETISGDLWVNVEKTAALGHYGERVIEKLRAGEPLEVSTAYHGDDLGPGEYDGEWHPNAKANLQPDHVALLPDELGPGKCSREDGCGIPPQGDGADADPAATPTPGTYAVAANTASPVGGLCVNTEGDAGGDDLALETDSEAPADGSGDGDGDGDGDGADPQDDGDGDDADPADVTDDGSGGDKTAGEDSSGATGDGYGSGDGPDDQQGDDREGVVAALRRLASTVPGVEVTAADAGAADGDADPSNGGDSQDADSGAQSTETMRAESRRDDASDSDTHGDTHMDRETRISELVNEYGYKRESLTGMGDNCLERTHALATNSDDDADPQDDGGGGDGDGDGDADPQDSPDDGGSPGDSAQDDDGGSDPQDQDQNDPQDSPDDGDGDGSDAASFDELAARLDALEEENEDLRETVEQREEHIDRLEEIVEEREQQEQTRHEELNERIKAHTDAYSDDQLAEMTEEQKVSTLRALGADPDAAVAANATRSGTDFGGVGGASPHMNVNNAGPGENEDEDTGTKHGGSFGDMLRGDGDD